MQNSVPLMGFDNFFPTYRILKALMAKFPDVSLDKDSFMVVSPDEGRMSRNIYLCFGAGCRPRNVLKAPRIILI